MSRITIHIEQKSPDFSVETALLFSSTIIKQWFQPLGLHTLCLTNSFVCNFLSSSTGFNLCSCFFRLTLTLRFRFRPSLGFHFHGLVPLLLLFLTPAVFAHFRSLQFWVLTTQPLFLPFPSLPASASQWLPQCSVSAFASPVFPVLSRLVSRAFAPGSRYSALLYVSFRPSLIRSHSCSSGAYFRLSPSVFSASLPLPFVRFFSASGYLACLYSFPSLPDSALQLAFPVLRFRSRFPSFPVPPRLISHAFSPGSKYSALLMVSFRPALLRSRSCSTGDPLSDSSSGAGA